MQKFSKHYELTETSLVAEINHKPSIDINACNPSTQGNKSVRVH